jgi:spermidine/putrescine transport system ATP-binding protein
MKKIVELKNVVKKYGKKTIVKNVNLDVYEGEFLTLLGPSGCGKTTILRLISGLETVTEGSVYIDGVDVTNLPASKRQVNTIFQNFALFPHMTVYENISFGLRMKKVGEEEIDKEVKKIIKLVKLEGFEDRYPKELSGGQQQRVAVARGVVMKPKVLLLDESLGALDLKLKKQMQIELKRIQKRLGMTFIYVTHNQEEALTMSDRIVIINNSQIEQMDTPVDIYKNPKTLFVADFIGESNILKGIVTDVNEKNAMIDVGNDLKISVINDGYSINEKKVLIIRPKDIRISKNETKNSIKAVVIDNIYNGEITKFIVRVGNKIELKVNSMDDVWYEEGENVYISFDINDLVILGDNNEKRK